MNTTDTGAWLTAKQEMKALAEEVRAHSTIRPSLRSVADRLTQIAAQMPEFDGMTDGMVMICPHDGDPCIAACNLDPPEKHQALRRGVSDLPQEREP